MENPKVTGFRFLQNKWIVIMILYFWCLIPLGFDKILQTWKIKIYGLKNLARRVIANFIFLFLIGSFLQIRWQSYQKKYEKWHNWQNKEMQEWDNVRPVSYNFSQNIPFSSTFHLPPKFYFDTSSYPWDIEYYVSVYMLYLN